MALKITFFNVGHGDSIVIEEVEGGNTTGVIVIDSNLVKAANSSYRSPAFEYLTSKGIKRLNAVFITHFDRDHYTGIEVFLNHFEVLDLYLPPVFSIRSAAFHEKLKQFRNQILEKAKLSADPDFRKPLESFAYVLAYVKNNQHIVQECYGKELKLRIQQMPNLNVTVYLPVARLRGLINQKLDQSKYDLDVFSGMNEASVALEIGYGGVVTLLAGDTEKEQWLEHRRQMRGNPGSLNAEILKSPHHGSRYNNDAEIYEYLLEQ